MLVEAFLAKMEFSDSLEDGTFSIIKEPIDDFYIGFPFDFREATLSDVEKHFKSLGYMLSTEAISSIKDMNTYAIRVFKTKDRLIIPCTVDYLYSIPSWG